IGSLRVIARTSAMHYQRTDKSLSQIARELHVNTLIQGSVLREGTNVRITAQLLDPGSGTHLWAESYEGDVSHLLELQARIARSVADAIQLRLTPSEQARVAKTYSVG